MDINNLNDYSHLEIIEYIEKLWEEQDHSENNIKYFELFNKLAFKTDNYEDSYVNLNILLENLIEKHSSYNTEDKLVLLDLKIKDDFEDILFYEILQIKENKIVNTFLFRYFEF